jgi:hypothetical protein
MPDPAQSRAARDRSHPFLERIAMVNAFRRPYNRRRSVSRALAECWILACLAQSGLHGQSGPPAAEELITDRPDFTESARVVPFGRLQLESGFTWARLGNEQTEWGAPELLARWGILPVLELRFNCPDRLWERNGPDRSGFGDAAVGAKIQLPSPGRKWDLAAIVSVSLPSGDRYFSTGAADPEMVLIWARDLSPRWSYGGQIVGAWLTEDGARRFNWSTSAVFGCDLGGDWGTFFELLIDVPHAGGTGVLAHHGYTRQLRGPIQLDVHVGVGLNDAAPDAFVGCGFSTRF